MEIITFTNHFNNNLGEQQHFTESNETFMIEALSKRLENELRQAKRTHFASGEVLLPNGLTTIISKNIYKLADNELYGLKGCTIFINFESEIIEKRNLTIIHCDQTTPTTFELYLTLKQATAGWNSFLPQFLKKMTRGGTVMISNDFDIEKKKLYRSYDE